MSRKLEGNPSQETDSRKTLAFGGDKADWEAKQVLESLPLSPKVIAYALLKPVDLEEYRPEGEDSGFIDKVKYKVSEKKVPTLRLELSKERKTKDGGNGKEAPKILEKQEEAKKRLRDFLKTENKAWKELKQEEERLGDKDSAGLEQDKDFIIHQVARMAELFIQFGEEFRGKLNKDVDQLFSEICRREGLDDELVAKAWAKALNESLAARPKPKKARSIR
jgi:hypothetical protein